MRGVSWPALAPWVMLTASNLFMTTAWYGHLRFKSQPLFLVIGVSWLIALPEYLLAVPANRWGSAVYSPAQLKVMQEAITLVVFVIFSAVFLGQPIKLSTLSGFGLILGGVAVIFLNR